LLQQIEQDALGFVNALRIRIKELRKKLRMDDEIAVAIDMVGRKYYVCRLCGTDCCDAY